jgi:hypothetical protein
MGTLGDPSADKNPIGEKVNNDVNKIVIRTLTISLKSQG